METKNCVNCGKPAIEGKIYCCSYCRVLKNSRDYHFSHRGLESYQKKRTKRMRDWYLENKERQKKNVLKNYASNPYKWKARTFNSTYRNELLKFIPQFCVVCNSPNIQFLHIKDYSIRYPLLQGKSPQDKQRLFQEYALNLQGICSPMCRGRLRWTEK